MKWKITLMLVLVAIFFIVQPFVMRRVKASTVTLTGTIRDAQGNPVNGSLIMQLAVPAIDTTTNTYIPNTPVYFQVINGAVTGGAPLLDNTNMQPAGDYYVSTVRDTVGNFIGQANYSIQAGSSFNIGSAVPTVLTTSNISYVNPVITSVPNNFTALQQFSAGIQTDSIAGTIPGGTMTLTTAAGSSSAGEAFTLTAGAGSTNNSGGSITVSAGGGTGTGQGGQTTFRGGNAGTTSVLGAGAVSFIGGNNTAAGGLGGNATLQGGLGGSGTGGNIQLIPGTGAVNGKIVLQQGIYNAGTGFQHVRSTGCMTGATAGNNCDTTIAWPGGWADTSYSWTCTLQATATLGHLAAKSTTVGTTTQLTVTTVTDTNAAIQGNIDCIGVHD